MEIKCARIGTSRHVCLAGDYGITKKCMETGQLDWDRSILSVPEIARTLVPGNVVIDVGAYIGDTTIMFEEAGCSVFAFEPRHDAFACLEHNCSRSICLRKAAGLKGQRVIFSEQASASSYLGNLGGRQVRSANDPAVAANPAAQMPVLALDELNPHRLHLIKIDAEGFEPNVLEGARELIQRTRPVMHIEVNLPALRDQGFTDPKGIYQMLYDWRYQFVVRQPERVGSTTPWDIVCTPLDGAA